MNVNGNPLKTYWPQITAIVLVSIAWGSNVNRIANAEGDLTNTDQRVEAIEKDLGEVKESLVRVETNQEHVDEDIDEIKGTLTAILDELRED